MTRFSDPDPLADVHKDAQAWVRKLHSGQLTAWEAGAFQRWVQEAPERLPAFQQAQRQWRLLGAAGAELLRRDAALARHHRQVLASRAAPGRRAFLSFAVGGAGAAAIAAYAPLDLWPGMRLWDADERTAAGELRELKLPGQVQVALNTRTSVRRLAQDDAFMGGLVLIEGEAAVDVPSTSTSTPTPTPTTTAKPFQLVAGVGRVSARAASFEVRYLDDVVCVTCLTGALKLDHPAGERVLVAAQQLRYNSRSVSGIMAVQAQDGSAWRRGELVFQQTPLPLVIDEINRYRAGRVVLAAEAARRKTVTARIKVADLDTALLQIQHSFRLRATALPSHILILS